MDLLDCALMGVSTVIRLNTVLPFNLYHSMENSANNTLMIFLEFFPENTDFEISCKLCPNKGDTLHELSKSTFWGK